MKLRAVFYARVSTDEEKQLNALEKQIQENKDVIEDMGWELVGFYIDEGKTGTTTKRRNDYKKMLMDIEEDLFDIVVCKDQDRLQRNTLDWYLFVDKMVTNGKRLYLYLDHKFFTPEEDALITGVKAIIAEEYSRNLSKKLNNANKRRVERAKRGEGVSAMGNGKSLGFAIKDNKWVQVPEEIELCKIVWDLYEEFDSIRKVRDWVNSHGYTNSVGKPFTSESISRILKNEKAKGVIVLGKYHHDFNLKKIVRMPEEDLVRVPAPELAYVSEERFDRVQARLKSKTSNGRGKYNGSDPLSGKIFCGKCGKVMYKHISNGYTGWYCSQKMTRGICEGESTTTVKMRKIFSEIAEGLEVNKNAVKASIMEWLENLKKELSKEDLSRNASRELQKAQNKKEKLLEVYLEGIISKDDYRAKYEALEAIIKEQEKLLAPLEENEDIKEIEETLKNIDSEIDAYISAPSFEDNKIDFLIEHTQKITVNGKHLIIELDLIAGAIIAGKDFLLFVHDKVYYCEHITNYSVELRLVA